MDVNEVEENEIRWKQEGLIITIDLVEAYDKG